ncbi:hypothetical protein OHA25_09610 [Nonomuraea sp. NBC_00507]|uniref:hypothetical protein n=1 Tax=Nonomuraea sp. NBC_00507 TaxID=2976002 RepID=UPI002E18F4B7
MLAAVAEQDPELVARLHIPEQVRGLFRPPARATSADAVTALDVELANRVDEVIEEMGAGIGGPS